MLLLHAEISSSWQENGSSMAIGGEYHVAFSNTNVLEGCDCSGCKEARPTEHWFGAGRECSSERHCIRLYFNLPSSEFLTVCPMELSS